ncbi:hypothetical protein MY4038_005465 [Beauveria bassiana]
MALQQPRQFPTTGFEVVDPAQKIEEERLPLYVRDEYYPMRIGEVVHEHYQVVAKLGYGTSSTVWLARDLRNIFVDQDWEITCIIDLEFACSLPVEFLESPSCWLEDGLVHELAVDDFAPKYAEFIEHLRHEEQLQNCQESKRRISSIMEQMWENGTFWFTLALKCPIAFNEILFDRILPSCFGVAVDELREADYSLAALTWGSNISGIIDRKLQDQEEYQKKLHQPSRIEMTYI